MMRTCNVSALTIPLVASLMAMPVIAANPPKQAEQATKVDVPRLEDLQNVAGRHIQKMHEAVVNFNNNIDALHKELNARLTAAQAGINHLKEHIGNTHDMNRTKEQLARLKEIDQFKTQMAAILQEMEHGAWLKEIDQLKRHMADLHKDLERISNIRKEITERKAPAGADARMGRSGEKNASAPNTGTINLVNNYPGPVTIILNDQSVYRLEQGGTQTLEAQPVGSFTYEIITPGGSRPMVTRTLAAKETFTITVVAQ